MPRQKRSCKISPASFLENTSLLSSGGRISLRMQRQDSGFQLPNLEAKYRALVEQIPAVVFMAYLDEAVGKPM